MTIATFTLLAMTGTLMLMLMVLVIEGALLANTRWLRNKRFVPRALLGGPAGKREVLP